MRLSGGAFNGTFAKLIREVGLEGAGEVHDHAHMISGTASLFGR